MALTIEDLGRLIAAKRGGRGVRATAIDVGISAATLSRIENGHMPDLETFAKICRWLERDPREFLGLEIERNAPPQAVVHFRKKRTIAPETAEALGELILAAQRALHARNRLIE
jgi:transcriptional regulator with XRE-family HTH domain